MPARKIPDREREIADDLRSRYDGALNLAEVGRELGLENRETIAKYLEGVPAQMVGKIKRWRVADLARHMYENEVV